jgi:starch-binding outer membrane protein, SusD/RagB family
MTRNMTTYNGQGGKRLRSLSRLLVAMALALPLAACDTDKIVEVEDPATRRPEDLNNAGAVPALVQGAFRQFVGGYSGFGDDSFLSASAAISDETYYGDTFLTRLAADKRILQPPQLGNITDASFSRLQQSRLNARRAFAVVNQFPTDAASDAATKAQLRTIEGYIYVTLSEGWCGSVPFSVVPDEGPIDPTAIVFGTPLSTAQMNDTAVARFNEASGFNASNNLTRVGKGRALLNNGQYAAAAAAVANVPTLYVFRLEHSANTGAENNPMFSLMANGRYGISNLEGGYNGTAATRPDSRTPPLTLAGAEGVPFRGLQDPRVPYIGRPSAGNGCFTSSIICWMNNNYPSNDADVPLASGVEARLIEAEAALQAGDAVTMMNKLNTLRASVVTLLGVLYPDQKQTFPPPGTGGTVSLPVLSDPGDGLAPADAFAARRNLLFQERALWLFNTGHRQGDLRRLVRTYGLPSTSVFPTGLHFRGGNYGTDVAYPLPFQENNNTSYDPAACITTKA